MTETVREDVVLYESSRDRHRDLLGPRDLAFNGTVSLGRFGKHEVEMAAGKLVLFLGTRGAWWSPFKITDAIEYYRQRGWDPDLVFFGLLGSWHDDALATGGYRGSWSYLAIDEAGNYRVTRRFVEACMRP